MGKGGPGALCQPPPPIPPTVHGRSNTSLGPGSVAYFHLREIRQLTAHGVHGGGILAGQLRFQIHLRTSDAGLSPREQPSGQACA